MPMRPALHPRWLPAAIALGLSLLLLGGCGAHRLSQAQDSFSKGAELENLLTLQTENGAVSYLSANDHYLIAHGLLKTDTKERKDELSKDGLLGHAYALHAMTLWRMADLATLKAAGKPMGESEASKTEPPASGDPGDAYYAEAHIARKNAMETGSQLGTRDKFLMDILPDLRDHDIGLRHAADSRIHLQNGYSTSSSVASAGNAIRFFSSSYKRIRQALAGTALPEGHPVRIYALQVQLQTLVAWNAILEAAVVTPPAAHDPGRFRRCFDTHLLPKIVETLDAFSRYDALRLQSVQRRALDPKRKDGYVTSRGYGCARPTRSKGAGQ